MTFTERAFGEGADKFEPIGWSWSGSVMFSVIKVEQNTKYAVTYLLNFIFLHIRSANYPTGSLVLLLS